MNLCPACHKNNSQDATVCFDCNHSLTPGPAGPTAFASNGTSHFESGYIFADRYRIKKTLGQGGMGIVYLAADLELREKQVALKLIHPEILSKPGALRRFQDEVLTCQELRHRSIVQVYDLKRYGEQRFYTIEYIPGRSLRDEMDRRRDKTLHFTLDEAAAVILPLLEALAYAHRKRTIHLDVKPENIILIGEFPTIRIKVVDFGIAKTLSASHMSEMAQALGTAYYMAPEQLNGKPVDHRADLYSVGMVLYELLTGEMALGMAEAPSVLNPDLPPGIDAVVGRLLKRLPEQRYADASEACKAIETIMAVGKVLNMEGVNTEDHDTEPSTVYRKIDIPVSKKIADYIEKRTVQSEKTRLTNSLGMEFVWIESGAFMMGSPEGEEGRFDNETQHQETLTKGFYMQTTPVTQGQWKTMMGTNPSLFKDGGDDCPVENVSCWDAQGFIQKLNAREPDAGYRLPTEAQWEYACRAGSTKAYFFGNDEDNLGSYAWYDKNSGKKTQPVGQKKANGWGLYDMLGNVIEWCQDWYGDYPGCSVTDSERPSGSFYRVGHGGSWGNSPKYLRCANRDRVNPGYRHGDLGFRLSRNP